VEGLSFLSEGVMQELLLVGLIDLVAAALASIPFWVVFSLRRRRRLAADLVQDATAGGRTLARAA